MGSLVALLVFAFFSYPFSVLPFPILLVFLLAMSGVNGTQMKQMWQNNTDKFLRKSVIIRLICVICVLVTSFCLWKQYPIYKAYKQWNSSRLYYQYGMYREAALSYEPLYPFLNDNLQFLFEYGSKLSQAAILDSKWIEEETRDFRWPQQMADRIRRDLLTTSNHVLRHATQISCDPMLYNIMGKNHQAMKEYDLAEENLLKSSYIVPNRLYPHYLLMKLYIEMGDDAKAQEAANIVLTKRPKVQSRAVEEMREEARKLKTKN